MTLYPDGYHLYMRGLNANLLKIFGGVFGRNRIDIESRTPFKTRDPGYSGNNFYVPMVVFGLIHRKWRGMNQHIVSRIIKRLFQFHKHLLGNTRQRRYQVRRYHLKMGQVLFGQNPGLKREPRSERADGNKMLVINHYPLIILHLLVNDIAENASSPVLVKPL